MAFGSETTVSIGLPPNPISYVRRNIPRYSGTLDDISQILDNSTTDQPDRITELVGEYIEKPAKVNKSSTAKTTTPPQPTEPSSEKRNDGEHRRRRATPVKKQTTSPKQVAKKQTQTLTRTPEQEEAYQNMLTASKNLDAKVHDYANGIEPQPTETDIMFNKLLREAGILPPEPQAQSALENAANGVMADSLYNQLLTQPNRRYGITAQRQTAPSVANGLDELAFEMGVKDGIKDQYNNLVNANLQQEPQVTSALNNAANKALTGSLYNQLLTQPTRSYGITVQPQAKPSITNGLGELAFELFGQGGGY